MRGLSEEDIKRFIRAHNIDNEHNWIAGALLEECHELDPWLPIENAPKDRKLVFLFENGYISSGYWDSTYDSWETIMDVHIESLSGKITHYKLLQEDPTYESSAGT